METLFINSLTPSGSGRFYTELDTNQGKFIYVPREFVYQGLRQGENQFFDQGFLNKEYLSTLKPIQLDEDSITEQLRNAGYSNPGAGFLISEENYKKYDPDPNQVTYYSATGKFAGPITGIGEKDGNLIYAKEGAGGSSYGYIDQGGTPHETTITTKRRFGFLGQVAGGITEMIAGVPLLPEIVGFATGNPYLYGSLKAAQTAGQGGDLGDVITAGLVGTGTALLGQSISSGLGGAPGGGPSELASVGETGYGLTGPIAPQPTVPSAFDQAVTGALTGTSPIQPSMQVGTGGYGSATLPSGAPIAGGFVAPTYPGVAVEQTYTPAPGSLQEALPGMGVETQASQAPFTAAPDSFAAATAPAATMAGYGLLSAAEPSTISVQQALRGAQLANQLMNPPEQPGMPMDQGGGMQAQGVDYSGLLGLMQRQVGMPNIGGLLAPAQIRYPNSLLG
jgi:hypothetical protein